MTRKTIKRMATAGAIFVSTLVAGYEATDWEATVFKYHGTENHLRPGFDMYWETKFHASVYVNIAPSEDTRFSRPFYDVSREPIVRAGMSLPVGCALEDLTSKYRGTLQLLVKKVVAVEVGAKGITRRINEDAPYMAREEPSVLRDLVCKGLNAITGRKELHHW